MHDFATFFFYNKLSFLFVIKYILGYEVTNGYSFFKFIFLIKATIQKFVIIQEGRITITNKWNDTSNIHIFKMM